MTQGYSLDLFTLNKVTWKKTHVTFLQELVRIRGFCQENSPRLRPQRTPTLAVQRMLEILELYFIFDLYS